MSPNMIPHKILSIKFKNNFWIMATVDYRALGKVFGLFSHLQKNTAPTVLTWPHLRCLLRNFKWEHTWSTDAVNSIFNVTVLPPLSSFHSVLPPYLSQNTTAWSNSEKGGQEHGWMDRQMDKWMGLRQDEVEKNPAYYSEGKFVHSLHSFHS